MIFVILPQTCIEKINDKIIDLSINTTSLGEMSNEVQDYYISQLERITKKYFIVSIELKRKINMMLRDFMT